MQARSAGVLPPMFVIETHARPLVFDGFGDGGEVVERRPIGVEAGERIAEHNPEPHHVADGSPGSLASRRRGK